jgi:hypothetical protein
VPSNFREYSLTASKPPLSTSARMDDTILSIFSFATAARLLHLSQTSAAVSFVTFFISSIDNNLTSFLKSSI